MWPPESRTSVGRSLPSGSGGGCSPCVPSTHSAKPAGGAALILNSPSGRRVRSRPSPGSGTTTGGTSTGGTSAGGTTTGASMGSGSNGPGSLATAAGSGPWACATGSALRGRKKNRPPPTRASSSAAAPRTSGRLLRAGSSSSSSSRRLPLRRTGRSSSSSSSSAATAGRRAAARTATRSSSRPLLRPLAARGASAMASSSSCGTRKTWSHFGQRTALPGVGSLLSFRAVLHSGQFSAAAIGRVLHRASAALAGEEGIRGGA